MTPEQFRELSKKVTDGTATDEEKVLFLKQLNAAIEAVVAELPRE